MFDEQPPAPSVAQISEREPSSERKSRLAIETRGLIRRFGDVAAVAGIDLEVPEGSFYGFLGPNGAGKSTTIKCLTGLLDPTRGSMRILGLDPVADGVEIKRRVGVVPEDLALFERLTGEENLAFVGKVHGLSRQLIEQRTADLFTVLQLERSAASSLVADYSHGMRKKVALAAALISAPRLLFLDEPFEGIDAVTSHQIKVLLQDFVTRGGTIFLTSHVLDIVERLVDHVAIIQHGRLVAQGPVDGLSTPDGEGERRSLEDIFLDALGAEGHDPNRIEWLTG
ncbi:MAG: ABC transporter ATP-binding protein [Thermoanaerobaculia bacterium]|nr:ABC transporter ATP-binding protein [Thermoanaerobaculia bacterium]